MLTLLHRKLHGLFMEVLMLEHKQPFYALYTLTLVRSPGTKLTLLSNLPNGMSF